MLDYGGDISLGIHDEIIEVYSTLYDTNRLKDMLMNIKGLKLTYRPITAWYSR